MPKFVALPGSISAAALGNGSSSQPQLEDLSSFSMSEAFEWNSGVRLAPEAPSFNVLYVETQGVPVLSALSGVVKETAQFLEPLTRFGIPQSSLMDKCPYYIADRAQRNATALAEAEAHDAQHGHGSSHHAAAAPHDAHGHHHQRHRMHLASHHILRVCEYTESGEIFHHPKHHIEHPKYLIGEVNPWSLVFLNLGFLAAVHRIGAGRWRV